MNSLYMNKLIQILLYFSAIALTSCSSKPDVSCEYVVSDRTIYADSPTELLTLHENQMSEINNPVGYADNFLIHDSLMLVSTKDGDGLLGLFSLESDKYYGSILKKGKAKGEFVYGFSLNLHMTLEESKDSLVSHIYDSATGYLCDLNLSKFIGGDNNCISESCLSNKLPHSAFWAKVVGDSMVLYRILDDMEMRQNRILKKNDEVIHNEFISDLNEFQIPINEDFNILSSLIAISPAKNMVVEAMIGMNYIHVYSLKGTDSFTICVGRDFDRLSDILNTSRFKRKYMFADLRAFRFGFAVMKFDVTEKAYQSDEDYKPSIMFFDWDGRCLGEVKSDFKFRHFDFDESKKEIYVLTPDDKILKKKIVL